MIEVFKKGSGITTIVDVDDDIRKETFIYVCSQVELCFLIVLSLGVMLYLKLIQKNISNRCLLINTLIIVGCILYSVYSRIKFNKQVKRIIIDNKKIIYSSREVEVTGEYIYINNLKPIKLNLRDIA